MRTIIFLLFAILASCSSPSSETALETPKAEETAIPEAASTDSEFSGEAMAEEIVPEAETPQAGERTLHERRISNDNASNLNPYADTKITYEIINSPMNTFGYRILVDGTPLINQPQIPGKPGVKGFEKKEDAVKVAELVMHKIKNNQMPPTVSEQELKELKVAESSN